MNKKDKKLNNLSYFNKKLKYRKNMATKFFTIVLGGVSIYILLFSVVAFGFIINTSYISKDKFIKSSDDNLQYVNNFIKNESKKDKIFTNSLIPKKTSFLVLGLDKSNFLLDVVILGIFDRDSETINLINIPRDTYVELSDSTRKFILDNGRKVPKTTKFSNLYNHAGKIIGVEAVKRHIRDMLDIPIDYHAIIYIDTFKEIVDILGPVTMEIPKGGLYYDDPVQNLSIKIPEGIQKIDGKLAEGLVRYRATYPRGDLQRIEMQQKFMMEIFKQTLSKKNKFNNIMELLSTIIRNVDTNFPLEEISKYLPYILRLKEDSLIMQTLPGTAKMMYDSWSHLNLSYFLYDKEECKKLINNLFYESYDAKKNIDIDINNIEKYKDLKIKILGSNKNSKIKYKKEELIKEGFNYVYTGIYKGYKVANTRIIASADESLRKELRKYFPTSTYIIDNEFYKEYENYDIVVIMGTLEE